MVPEPGQGHLGLPDDAGGENTRVQQVALLIGQQHFEALVRIAISVADGTVAELLDRTEKFALHRLRLT